MRSRRTTVRAAPAPRRDAPALLRAAATVLAGLCLASGAAAVQPGFKIKDDQLQLVPLQRLTAGIRLDDAVLAQLTTSGAINGSALEALSSWNFTPSASIPGGHDTFGQVAPVSSAWTCYLPDTISCGFGASDVDALFVNDSVVDGRAARAVAAAAYDATTGVLRGRATISDEGESGETRLCIGTAADAPLVPVYVLPNVEAGTGKRYMQASDPGWQSPVFDCFAAATRGAPCKAIGGTKATLDAVDGVTEGRIRNRFVRAGVVTLPSGHVLDSLLVESFTSYTGKDSSCFFGLLTYQQWRLAWMVPYYGSILSLTSLETTPLLTGFTTAKSTFLGYAVLPPVSIEVTSSTPTSVTVSWNPGALGGRSLSGYEVHWGAVSGKTQAPTLHSGPIAAGTTSYTITGLSAGQTIFVSVTSRRSYTDPVSGVTTLYESIKLPQLIGSDANGDGVLETSYPPEVSATTPVPGACVLGDVYPDGVGNGSVSLADFAIARRKALGTVAVNDRDRTCGDVHPGAYSCQPEGQPGRWCVAPNALFQQGDVILIRRRVAGTLTFACSGCPQVRLPATPSELRRPGDLTPRGASDGVIDIGDVVLALRLSVGLESPSAEELLRGDVSPADRSSGAAEPTGDGRIDVGDVVLMLRASVGLDTVRWPLRRVTAHMNDAYDFTAFQVRVAGWPAWAAPEPTYLPAVAGCDDTPLDVIGDTWGGLCALDPAVGQGPADLFQFQYRGIEPVAPAGLSVVTGPGQTYVLRPDASEPEISVSLSAP